MRPALLMICVCTFMTACAPKATVTAYDPMTTREEASVAFRAYIDAINEGDTQRAGEFYDRAEGFHWVERGSVGYETGDEAAAAVSAFTDNNTTTHMAIIEMRVAELSPDAATVSVQSEFTAIMTGGMTMKIPGWMSVAMARRDDGRKIAAGMTSNE